ncbi:hypothetical protein [Bradyrhizobium sp. 195]|uniref:hypothetical protein n=1 Tax=Bradyrhizobium sp. 195 TaxID=2782662 RepID=UPI002000830A|nr:hypothetical protein [Bradyrhizobium sp. 195]UPK31251.1 hypothetical protein IVB26_39630 [Bradyrhizobium sp. 195]
MLLAAVICLLIGFGFAADARGKWINSAGLLFDVSGVIQLHISGLFEDILRHFGDEEKFPYGPPSNITRKIIDNPDVPVRMWLRNNLFFEATTAFYLLLAGFVFQLIGTWV